MDIGKQGDDVVVMNGAAAYCGENRGARPMVFKAIHLSADKYCSATQMLSELNKCDVKITHGFEVIEA